MKKRYVTPSEATPMRWTKEHRARTIPDKKKQANKRACRKKGWA